MKMNKALDGLAVALMLVVVFGFAFIAARGLLDPLQASARYGMPVSDAAGALFYRVFLSRNLIVVMSAFVFLLLRKWQALAILTTAAAVLPAFDIAILVREFGDAAPLRFHIATLVVMTLLAGLWWRKVVRA
ncbi:MAG: DUF4267 domain-containing protein [Afipia sp.]